METSFNPIVSFDSDSIFCLMEPTWFFHVGKIYSERNSIRWQISD